MNGLVFVPRRKRYARFTLSNAVNRRSVEALVMQAYLQLVRVAWNEIGSRSASLARYGSYEVRLLERMSADVADIPHLWVELYANDIQTSIDSCGCDDLEAAAIAAEDIMLQAEQLARGEWDARSRGRKTASGQPDSGI
jgi:hypothetical protein